MNCWLATLAPFALRKEPGVPARDHASNTGSAAAESECGLSHATIARALGIAKGSVANYVAAAQVAGISASVARELDDAALLTRLHP